jgi:AraC-like DNA-binding protein
VKSTTCSTCRPARRLAADRFIATHLADPWLDPAMVAAHLAISRRSLYALYSDDGDGVAGAIRRRRLRRARRMLTDPAQRHQPIAEIAAAVGMPIASSFTRAFRAEYGATPCAASGSSTAPHAVR